MKIGKSADIYEDSGIVNLFYEIEIGDYFKDKDFGNSEVELFFVINCLKQPVRNRIRYSNKDKVLYWDVILDYQTVKVADVNLKKRILANSIIDSFGVLDKYQKLKLNKEQIKETARDYFSELGWI